jgi:hypothetical protein
MREPLQLERGPAAHDQCAFKQGLERDDEVLPAQTLVQPGRGQGRRRAAIDASRQLVQPAAYRIFASQGSGIPVLLKPNGIDDQPFGQMMLEPV